MMTPYPSTVGERKDELFAVGKHCLNSLHFLALVVILLVVTVVVIVIVAIGIAFFISETQHAVVFNMMMFKCSTPEIHRYKVHEAALVTVRAAYKRLFPYMDQ
ncbi:unnamed protein product [Heligmosomoides polygyrus]|uniref:Uncharacterized protein n=1 Tax=Heligmosomoides polygyrus TaxID=6339 RepID=A0A183GRB2_HELPZ|nr:unnamed protein product [Heligmosomoides polygyrus]